MRIAMPVWEQRVSPVFDVAMNILVAEVDPAVGRVVEVGVHALDRGHPATALRELGVHRLICSAISPPVEAALWFAGIEVVPDICGAPDDIIAALLSGDGDLQRFRSPGSRRDRARRSAGAAASGAGRVAPSRGGRP